MRAVVADEPLVIGSYPRICAECGKSRPGMLYPMHHDGSYGDVCIRCQPVANRDVAPQRNYQAAYVPWAGGGWDVVDLSWHEVNRIVLIAGLRGLNASEIQALLREANEAVRTGRELVL